MPVAVALLVDCLTDQYRPRVGMAAAAVLTRLGCRVIVPAGQTCCGLPQLHAGLAADAATVARRTVALLEPTAPTYVVTPGPACCGMVRDRYPKLLADDPAYEAGMWDLAGRTYDLVEFIGAVLKPTLTGLRLPRPTTATYQPACPLRTLAVADDAPRLLRQIGNLSVRPLPSADVCCGFGGPFAVVHPSIAGRMADAKAAAVAATGVDVVVCNETGCALTIGSRGTRVVHAAELLAEAMGIDVER